MRSIFVAAVAAASVLLANLASAEGCTGGRRPLVTVAPNPVGEPVVGAALVDGN